VGAGVNNGVPSHLPVMTAEVERYLQCCPGQVVVDCTVGEGGHALQLLPLISPGGRLIGLDRDGEILKIARHRLRFFENQIHLEQANFKEIGDITRRLGLSRVDRVLFDLGVSSLQLGTPDRGFSFRLDDPLDMRMDRREDRTAADLVNRLSLNELEEVIRRIGEERWAKRISRAIGEERRRRPITTTGRLADVISRAVPGRGRIHPATRTFQALRIYLNRELEALSEALPRAVSLLAPGGRLCVISFHSLEDRIV
jgi:16S rRNA (cytosine1402-N4)-methyltransferase